MFIILTKLKKGAKPCLTRVNPSRIERYSPCEKGSVLYLQSGESFEVEETVEKLDEAFGTKGAMTFVSLYAISTDMAKAAITTSKATERMVQSECMVQSSLPQEVKDTILEMAKNISEVRPEEHLPLEEMTEMDTPAEPPKPEGENV
jgi:hypothetical protein